MTSTSELDVQKAPVSAANFLKLVDDGFYDGLIFHRVLANFVIQAGGYEANLTYREPQEPSSTSPTTGCPI